MMGLFRAILRRSSQRASARYVFEEIGAEILVYCFRWNHIYTDHNVVGNHESEHRLQVGRPQQYVNIKFLQGVVNHRAKMLVSDLRGRNRSSICVHSSPLNENRQETHEDAKAWSRVVALL